MCGINGYISRNKNEDLNHKIHLMNDLIIHRGPDHTGCFIDFNKDYQIGLGMTRLSIIDLKNGSQPMYSSDKSVAIVLNGEIYNYKILKKSLKEKGVNFKTESDTEVVLQMYLKYGVKSFRELDGMFSFSIYDKNIDKVFIARDYFGEKPLYYHLDKNVFVWGSELKSIVRALESKPKISYEGMSIYFQLTYIPAPFSIYENIYKLEPNQFIEFDCSSSNLKLNKINNNIENKSKISFKQAKRLTYDLVMDSVISRSVSDVPIGTFLSGGVDSSIVSLCLSRSSSKPINTFSVGFKKNTFDETDKSRVISKLINSNHHEFVIESRDFENSFSEILLNFDEPFGDSSALPTFLVSKLTKGHVKVILTGDGGDEVFGGYNKYYIGKINQFYTKIIPSTVHNVVLGLLMKSLNLKQDSRRNIFRIKRFLNAVDYDDDFYYKIISLGFQKMELKKIIEKKCLRLNSMSFFKKNQKAQTLKEFRSIDKQISLEGDMLVKVDRTSMLNSIECRSPFLNKRIWDFTNSLPDKFLIKGFNKKHLLKEAFKDFFPKGFLNKSKKGFGVPVGDWMRGLLKKELISYIDPIFLKNQGIFSQENISKIVLDHINGKTDNTFRVWAFFCFQKWYKQTYLKL